MNRPGRPGGDLELRHGLWSTGPRLVGSDLS